MPTFKDINSFVQKTPDGTEKIQVSATQYVTLQQIANLANISDANIMGKKLAGFTRAPWANYYPVTDDITANSTLLAALKAIISSLNPIVGGFTFRILSHSDLATGAILQMHSVDNDLVGNIIWNQTKNSWGFSNTLIEDQRQANEAIEGVGSTFSFSGKPWTVIDRRNNPEEPVLIHPNSIVQYSNTNDPWAETTPEATLHESWKSIGSASAVVVMHVSISPGDDLLRIQDYIENSLVNNSVTNEDCAFYPNFGMYDFSNGYTGQIYILYQRMGPYMFVTLSPVLSQ